MEKIYDIGKKIKITGNGDLIHKWRKLQTSDHFCNMGTKHFKDNSVYKYPDLYGSPYDAFISYMNILQDLEMEVDNILEERGFLINGQIINNKINL